MVTVPSFILRRLYVKGTLKNRGNGFEFQLRNTLGSGYGIKLYPLNVDGTDIPIENCCYSIDGEDTSFSEVSKEQPFVLAIQKSVTMIGNGVQLNEGPHKILVSFDVPGLGTLKLDFTDVSLNG